MRELKVLFQLFSYCRLGERPALMKYALLKTLRRPARVDLKLRGHSWVAMTTKPSGLHFFFEVVVRESYAVIERDLLSLSDPIVIDGGANCGAFALWALSVNAKARVISFEPGEAFANLAINRDRYVENHGDHWQVEKCALSSKVGACNFVHDAHSSMGHIEEGDDAPVPARTIDDLGLSPEVLKIDVEGHELEVLKGSEKTLGTARVVVLEYHSEELRAQCIDFLASRHFVVEEERTLLIGRKEGLVFAVTPSAPAP
jgi:FkbM family methyltransferase